jgi:cytidine deaminase
VSDFGDGSGMRYRVLDPAEERLIAAAFDVIDRNYVRGRHHVGSAVRASSGVIYVGVHLESPGGDVCAEWVAIGSAVSAGEREVTACVAVRRSGPGGTRPGVMSPCGACRELLTHYGPEAEVVVPTPAGPKKLSIGELLPIPYDQNRPPEPT